MQINLIKYLIRTCPIPTSSLRQPDNFWQTEFFVHSIHFHFRQLFTSKDYNKLYVWQYLNRYNASPPVTAETAETRSDGAGDIFIGFQFCLQGSEVYNGQRVNLNWNMNHPVSTEILSTRSLIYWDPIVPGTGRAWDWCWHYYCPPLLHITRAIRLAYCRGLFSWILILRPENKIIFQKCPWAVLARPRLQENRATLYKG